jgi:hypothetical protein
LYNAWVHLSISYPTRKSCGQSASREKNQIGDHNDLIPEGRMVT